MREQKLFLAGSWSDGEDALVVRSPWDGATVARVARGGPATLKRAAEAAERSAGAIAALPPERRAAILEAARADLLARKEEVAATIVEEAGKPRRSPAPRSTARPTRSSPRRTSPATRSSWRATSAASRAAPAGLP
jgi:NAD-dependent aldehyde dehydrogenases